MRLGNSLLDPSENKLYVYELYDVSPKSSSIVVIDLDNPNDWKSISDLERSKQTHHHNALFDSSRKKIIIFGGYGYIKEFPAEKFFRDAKLCTIGEGTSEIQKLVISRELLK